jgi:hypothetical protein
MNKLLVFVMLAASVTGFRPLRAGAEDRDNQGDSSRPYHILQRDMNTSRISYTSYDGQDGHGAASGELAEGWHHVAGTYDAAARKMEVFIDGRSVGTSSYVKTTCASSELGIGGASSAGRDKVGNAFRGRIDEVRSSHGVRSFTQAPAEPYSPDDSTALLLHCDETAGPARDASGKVRSAVPPDPFDQNATLDAVYDFLVRACDVRWLASGEIGLEKERVALFEQGQWDYMLKGQP